MSPAPPKPILDWDADGAPRSALYGDVYFSREDGLAESRAVFLRGCDLPRAWAGRRDFVVGELGFGTGLNILALWDLWRAERPPGGRLHLFSVEAHPISRGEAARALAAWPQLAALTERLLALWPPPTPGFHRLDLAADVTLDLAVMEVGEALAQWRGQAGAWFLDGFSPAANPAMWRSEVLRLVGERSAPGARAATFTVAGAVRRGLAEAGFTVDKRPGFGRKKERLEARYPGVATQPPSLRVAVIGAGIAGASLARALSALGLDVQMFEAQRPGAGASGNAAALVTPRLDAGLGVPARLHAQAFDRATRLYAEIADAVIGQGAVVLPSAPRDPSRFAKIAAGGLFSRGALHSADAGEIETLLGEVASPGLVIDQALSVDPAAILAAWLPPVRQVRIEQLQPGPEGWRLLDARGALVAEVDAICLAGGWLSRGLIDDLPLQSVRGQASLAAGITSGLAASFGGYATPAREGLMFGATFDRDDENCAPRAADDAANLRKLAKALPRLAERAAATSVLGRASIRAATPDRMPLAGELRPGLFLLTGLGSHGFCLAPLLAEDVAAQIADLPSPLPADLAAKVAPARYFPPSKQADETS